MRTRTGSADDDEQGHASWSNNPPEVSWSLERVGEHPMKIATMTTTAVATAVIATIGITGAPIASLYPNGGYRHG
jgi:hypothetical protein